MPGLLRFCSGWSVPLKDIKVVLEIKKSKSSFSYLECQRFLYGTKLKVHLDLPRSRPMTFSLTPVGMGLLIIIRHYPPLIFLNFDKFFVLKLFTLPQKLWYASNFKNLKHLHTFLDHSIFQLGQHLKKIIKQTKTLILSKS